MVDFPYKLDKHIIWTRFQKLNIKHITANNAEIFLKKNADGTFNYENLFPSTEKKKLKIKLKKTELKIKKYNINLENENFENTVEINGSPLISEIRNKKYLTIKTQGNINDKIFFKSLCGFSLRSFCKSNSFLYKSKVSW